MALAPASHAQGRTPPVEKWRIDPYTKNDPEALAKAGYTRYAPFEFGEHAGKPVTTTQIEETLGKIQILWVETAHYRLGSALPAFPIPASDRRIKMKLEDELSRLRRKLPKVNPRTRTLDPWLRVHLFAQRLEDLYEDFSKRLGVTDDSFPTKPATLVENRYMGEGRYLGQPEKYTVLILQKTSDFTRYLSLFVGKTQEFPQRWNWKTVGSLFFVTAEGLESRLRYDTGMHCHIVFNTAHALIAGYRFYAYDLPVWFTEGMAHWYSRRVDPDWALDFDQNESARADMLNDGKWQQKVRMWLNMNKLRPAADLLALRDFGALTKYDHVKSWSIIDFLMSMGDEKWRDYMNEIKGFIDPKTGLTAAKEIPNLQRNGLRKAYDLNPLSLDEKWQEWVVKTYPVK